VSTPNNDQLRPAFNRQEATEFLFDLQMRWMAQGIIGYIELRSFPDRERGSGDSIFIPIDGGLDDVKEGVTWAAGESAKQRGVFYGANPRSTTSGRKEAVTQIVTSYAELDHYKVDKTAQETFDFACDSPVEPTFVTCSGRGTHVLFCHEPASSDAWLRVQEGLYQWGLPLGADKAVVTDWARVLRLPGAPNWKESEPLPTSVLFDSKETRPIQHSSLAEAFVKASAPQTSSIVAKALTYSHPIEDFIGNDDVMCEGNPDRIEGAEGRNDMMWKVASYFAGKGIPQSLALTMCLDINRRKVSPSLEDGEIEDQVRRAYKYEPNERIERTARVEVAHRAADREVFAATGDDIYMAEIERPEWVWPGFARGTYNVSPAEPNAGKTSFFLTAGVRTVIGNPMFDQACPWNTPEFSVHSEFDTENAPAVIYVVGEDTWEWAGSDIQTIYKNAFNVPDDHIRRALRERLLFYIPKRGYRKFDFCNPLDQDRIRRDGERITNGFKRPLIVIADMLTATHTLPDGASLAADHHVKNYITEPAVMLAGDTNGVVIHLCHVPKGTGRKSREGSKSERAQLAKNSGQIWGAARTVADLAVMREKTPEQNLISRFGLPKEKGCTMRDFQIEIDSETRAISWNNDEIKSEGQENYARLREIIGLNPGGVSKKALLAKVGLSETAAQRHLDFGIEKGHFEKRGEPGKPVYFYPIPPQD
jgi:Primase C terminal 1 (PriCT-1)